MTFYVVNGPADACGRGCDRWIEAEGRIEADSAARLKIVLDRLKETKLPIFFNSPGGNLDQAILMGNMLHRRLPVAGIGRSLVRECGFEAQDSAICVKVKQSGQELHGDLFTAAAVCASACPFVVMGAPVHEIAPDATLGVHSPKVILNFHGAPQPDAAAIAAADHRGQARADRMVGAYLAKMGIEAGLLTVARSTKFEDIHILTREEIARFGIDRREQVENSWRFASNGLNRLQKIAEVRSPGETPFRLLQLGVICLDTEHFFMEFRRPTPSVASYSLIAIAGNGGKQTFFSNPPARRTGFEHWGVRMARPALVALIGAPQLILTETAFSIDGRPMPRVTTLSNDGGTTALNALLTTCPTARDAAPQANATGDRAAR